MPCEIHANETERPLLIPVVLFLLDHRFRCVMFLLGKNFYLIFISVWIIGLYFVLTNLHTGTNNDKVYEVRIEAMQVEIDRLAQRLSGRPADEQRMEDR